MKVTNWKTLENFLVFFVFVFILKTKDPFDGCHGSGWCQ